MSKVSSVSWMHSLTGDDNLQTFADYIHHLRITKPLNLMTECVLFMTFVSTAGHLICIILCHTNMMQQSHPPIPLWYSQLAYE